MQKINWTSGESVKCKFPNKECSDRYWSHGVRKGIYCRLAEWRKKKGVCPYDHSIQAKPKGIKKAIRKKQQFTMADFYD